MTDTPAAAATRARCQEALIAIGTGRARLDPIIAPDGTLNSLQSLGPPTSGGGSIFVLVEAIHGPECAALGGARCTCGAQRLLEGFVFKP